MVTIKDLLKEKGNQIFSITPDKTVYEALVLMAEKEIGAILVLENDRLVGIFSERDYARRLILKGHFSKESLVGDYMTKNPITIAPEKDIFSCMEIMTEQKIRHLPILDQNNIIGIITIGDIVNAIIHSQKKMIKDLEDYITGKYGH